MYARGENYKWEGDHGRIASSIPPLSGTALALTELGLLKEQEEQRCSTGKGSSAAEGTARGSILPKGTQPHSTSAGKAGQGWWLCQVQENQRSQEQTWKQQSSGQDWGQDWGSRLHSLKRDLSFKDECSLPVSSCSLLALGMLGCCSLHSNDMNLLKPVTAWPSQAIKGKAVLLFAEVSHQGNLKSGFIFPFL